MLRPLSAGFLAVISLSGSALPSRAAGFAPCDAVVGQWTWFTKGVVSINRDGTIVHDPGNDGTWECTDAGHNWVTLKWRLGGHVNRMVLSANGRTLTSADPNQAFVTGTRIGAAPATPAPVSPSPASPSPASPSPASPAPSSPVPVATTGADPWAQGRKLAESGKCAEAIPYFDKAIQQSPRYAKAYSDRGRCLVQLGHPSVGLQDLNRAVALAPNEMNPWFNRAGFHADLSDGASALSDLDQSIRNDPMNPASRAARAGLLEALGRPAEAKLDADIAYRQVEMFKSRKRPVVDMVLTTWRAKRVRMPTAGPPPGDPLKAAAAASKAGRYRAALAALDAAIAKAPGDDALLAARGRLRVEIGLASGAVEDLTAVLQRHPSAEAFTRRGLAYRQLCRFKEEVADYGQAVRLDPRFTQAYFERAFTTIHYHKGDDAVPDLTRVIALDPKNWLAYNYRGELNRFWVKLAPAMADFRQAVALAPGFGQAYCNMAFTLRAARRMGEVDGWLAKCYALDPSEREVTGRVFANIEAQEQQAARDMAAMRGWSGGGGSGATSSEGGGGGGGGPGCSYTSYGACNAEAAGDRWAADRIEQRTASGSEQDWYGR